MRHSSALSPALSVGQRSAWDRIANVVIDPAVAFQGIDARPSWGVAFVALVALRVGSQFAF